MRQFKEFDFRMKQHERELKSVINNSQSILQDNLMIKDTMREQNTQFSTNLKEIHGHMLQELETVRHKVNDVDSYAENLKLTMGDQDIKVAELKIRIDSTENKLIQLDQARVKLESGKTDVVDF